MTSTAPTPPPPECFPPDPSVPGLWWVRHAEIAAELGPLHGNQVWVWDGSGVWQIGPAYDEWHPQDAYASGWRCIARAEPPEVTPWHPAATAPLGQDVLVWNGEELGMASLDHRLSDPDAAPVWTWDAGADRVEPVPTHWMPLPKPPEVTP